jgi:hypothetical protein
MDDTYSNMDLAVSLDGTLVTPGDLCERVIRDFNLITYPTLSNTYLNVSPNVVGKIDSFTRCNFFRSEWCEVQKEVFEYNYPVMHELFTNICLYPYFEDCMTELIRNKSRFAFPYEGKLKLVYIYLTTGPFTDCTHGEGIVEKDCYTVIEDKSPSNWGLTNPEAYTKSFFSDELVEYIESWLSVDVYFLKIGKKPENLIEMYEEYSIFRRYEENKSLFVDKFHYGWYDSYKNDAQTCELRNLLESICPTELYS